MHEDAWLEISPLGLAREKMRPLLLLPLAYVAAASRRRDLPLLDRLIESSARAARLDALSADLARSWIRRIPTQRQFESGLLLLRSACESDAGSLRVRDLIESVLWACSAAQLDRERIGRRYTSVSTSARRAIGELELLLGIEVGELWSDVLDELGEGLPRSSNALPPRFQTAPESARDLAPGSAPVSGVPPSSHAHRS